MDSPSLRTRATASLVILSSLGVAIGGEDASAQTRPSRVIPGVADPACTGDCPGDLTLRVHLGFPPSQDDYDQAREQIQRASSILCDATDGNIRISDIRFRVGAETRLSSDVLWVAGEGRAFSQGRGTLGAGDHVVVFGRPDDPVIDGGTMGAEVSMRGDVFAHELGHLLLGLADQYSKPADGYGQTYEARNIQGTTGSFTNESGTDLYYSLISPFEVDRRHSLMQQSGSQQCSSANPGSDAAFSLDPYNFSKGAQRCMEDSVCTRTVAGVLLNSCATYPHRMTELSTTASGFETRIGTAAFCPAAKPTREVVLHGDLSGTFNPVGCNMDLDGDGSALDPGEECDPLASPPLVCGAGSSLFTVPCSPTSCRYNRGSCVLSTAGACDGVALDAGEECDGSIIPDSCETLGFTGGRLDCNPLNCHYDVRQCKGGDRTSIPTLASPAPGWSRRTLRFRDAGSSNTDAWHELLVDTIRQGASATGPAGVGLTGEVTVVIGIDSAEFGGSGYHLLARYDITFDATTREAIEVNGSGLSAPKTRSLFLGSVNKVAEGMVIKDGQITLTPNLLADPTGAWGNGAPEQEMKVVFDEILNDGNRLNGFLVEGRFGTVASGVTLTGEDDNGVIVLQDLGGLPIPAHDTFTNTELCQLSYNVTTQRFEMAQATWAQWQDARANTSMSDFRQTIKSDWEVATRVLSSNFGVAIDRATDPELLGELPSAPAPARCNEVVEFSPTFAEIEAGRAKQIVLALDRSASMGAVMDAIFAEGIKRLDFVKAGARSLLLSEANQADAPQVGVIWFNRVPEVRFPSPPIEGEIYLGMPTLVPPGGSSSSLSSIDVQTILDSHFVDSREPGGTENPVPLGGTWMLPAMGAAKDMLSHELSTARGRAVYFLTDGEDNIFGQAGLTLMAALGTKYDSQVHAITTALDDGAGSDAELAGAAGGSFTASPNPADLPLTFFELSALDRGQPLTFHFDSDPDRLLQLGVGEQINPVTVAEYDIEVEAGARELRFQVSASGGYPIPEGWLPPAPGAPTFENLMAGLGRVRWDPQISVKTPGPGGAWITPEIIEDPFFRIAKIAFPSAGTWTIRVGDPDNHKVAGFVDNPDISAAITADTSQVAAGGDVTVRAVIVDGIPLGKGANVSAVIIRPDDSKYSLTLSYNDLEERYEGTFPSTAFRGRGSYKLVGNMAVGADIGTHPGEDPDDPGAHERRQLGRPARAFTRQPSSGFHLNLADQPPLPTTGPRAFDCDLDGILNVDEQAGDFDGDGLDDVCDGDADNDDSPDGLDPNTHDPNVPLQTVCTDSPVSVACCDQIWSCHGASNWVLYADERLDVRDQVRIDRVDGKIAPIGNAGTNLTSIGVEAHVGDILSNGNVTLADRANVDGDVRTTGSISEHADVSVSGELSQGANITLPPLGHFFPRFPDSTGSISLEPDTIEAIAPGSYGNVSIKSRSTLHLVSGVYYFESLNVSEPDATVSLYAPNGAPLYIFVRDGFTQRGKFVDTQGKEDHLFIGYFGVQPAHIETAFVGTFVAPFAKINLKPLNGATHHGAFFGNYIEVDAGVIIKHVPFPFPWKPWGVILEAAQSTPGGDAGTNPDGNWGGGSVANLLSFEDPSRTWSASSPAGYSSQASHGAQSRSIDSCGWQTLTTPVIDTVEFSGVGESIEVDVRIPAQVANPYWVGTIELQTRLNAGAWTPLGQSDLTPLDRGGWTPLSFELPADAQSLLLETGNEVVIRLVVNTSNCQQPILLDNVRFGGTITPIVDGAICSVSSPGRLCGG